MDEAQKFPKTPKMVNHHLIGKDSIKIVLKIEKMTLFWYLGADFDSTGTFGKYIVPAKDHWIVPGGRLDDSTGVSQSTRGMVSRSYARMVVRIAPPTL